MILFCVLKQWDGFLPLCCLPLVYSSSGAPRCVQILVILVSFVNWKDFSKHDCNKDTNFHPNVCGRPNCWALHSHFTGEKTRKKKRVGLFTYTKQMNEAERAEPAKKWHRFWAFYLLTLSKREVYYMTFCIKFAQKTWAKGNMKRGNRDSSCSEGKDLCTGTCKCSTLDILIEKMSHFHAIQIPCRLL